MAASSNQITTETMPGGINPNRPSEFFFGPLVSNWPHEGPDWKEKKCGLQIVHM